MEQARPGLDLEEDLAYQRREWAFERAGWAVLAGVLALALAGGLGHGRLADGAAREGGLALDYERMPRYRNETELRLAIDAPGSVPRSAPGGVPGPVRLWLDRGWLAGNDLVRVRPRPVRETSEADRVVLEFAAPAARITLMAEPEGYGFQRLRLGLVGGPTLDLPLFVWP